PAARIPIGGIKIVQSGLDVRGRAVELAKLSRDNRVSHCQKAKSSGPVVRLFTGKVVGMSSINNVQAVHSMGRYTTQVISEIEPSDDNQVTEALVAHSVVELLHPNPIVATI